MKYLEALSTIRKTPKEALREGYQEAVDKMFYNSSDWYTIEEEASYGSGEYSEIDVRINNVVFGRTGLPQGDDYKVLIFKDIDHETSLGWFYKFDNNYWVVENIMKKSSLHTTVTVRRCNNFLKWVTPSGSFFQIPCAIDYGIKENRDYSTAGSKVVSPSGLLRVTTQLNAKTNTIKPNKRFLFGNKDNWTAFKVMGGGIENFNNLVTGENDSLTGYVRFTMNADYVNEDGDDIVNGIADFYENNYTITISESSITGNPSDTIQLYSTVELNGNVASRNVSWSSSNENIATVDSNGLVTFVAEGTCSITATIENNSYVSDSCSAIVTLAPVSEYQVVVSPNTNYVLEGETEQFTVELYLNNSLQADTFSFTLNSGTVPSANYEYTVIDGNNFSVKNIEMYLEDILTIDCVSGVHSTSIEITLRGSW